MEQDGEMSENETIADIIAEKRERADEIERDVAAKMASGEMVSDQYARELIADLRMEADRIEAAAKRELGNAAAMREAVEKCVDLILRFGNAELDETPLEVIIDIEAILKAALSAPQSISEENTKLGALFTEAAENVNSESVIDTSVNKEAKPLRNCDMYANWYDAHKAWERLPKNELGYFVQENGVECCENAWLFATAQEGGNDGK